MSPSGPKAVVTFLTSAPKRYPFPFNFDLPHPVCLKQPANIEHIIRRISVSAQKRQFFRSQNILHEPPPRAWCYKR